MGGCYTATTCGSANLTLSVYTATSTGPGSFLFSGDFGSANQTATGKLIGGSGGFDEYAYSVSFSPILVPAGTFYLAISNDPSSGRFGVETTSNPPFGAVDYQKLTAADPFTAIDANLALDLTYTAAAPEPSTWVMLILGFVGLGLTAHRQKNSARSFA